MCSHWKLWVLIGLYIYDRSSHLLSIMKIKTNDSYLCLLKCSLFCENKISFFSNCGNEFLLGGKMYSNLDFCLNCTHSKLIWKCVFIEARASINYYNMRIVCFEVLIIIIVFKYFRPRNTQLKDWTYVKCPKPVVWFLRHPMGFHS